MDETPLLLVDDEPAMGKLLQRGLASYGYTVYVVTNGTGALSLVVEQAPMLVLLDINLGLNPNGLEVCQQLREVSNIPVIMVSARNDVMTKLAALNAGADDYITKPFRMDELEARIRAVLRRALVPATGFSKPGEIQVHDLSIDFVKRQVRLQGEALHLTPKEYELLRVLATHPGMVMTTKSLFDQVWGTGNQRNPDQNVRVFINILRKKLRDDRNHTNKPRYIYSEPGIGYRFTDQG